MFQQPEVRDEERDNQSAEGPFLPYAENDGNRRKSTEIDGKRRKLTENDGKRRTQQDENDARQFQHQGFRTLCLTLVEHARNHLRRSENSKTPQIA